MEGKSSDPQSHIKQCCQLAHYSDEVFALNYTRDCPTMTVEVTILLSSVSIEALCQMSICHSDDSSLLQLLMLLSAQSQDGQTSEGTPNTMVTARWHTSHW